MDFFTVETAQVFGREGVTVIPTPVQAPNANGHAERWVGSVRREFFDRLLMFSRRQLGHVLRTTQTATTAIGRTARLHVVDLSGGA